MRKQLLDEPSGRLRGFFNLALNPGFPHDDHERVHADFFGATEGITSNTKKSDTLETTNSSQRDRGEEQEPNDESEGGDGEEVASGEEEERTSWWEVMWIIFCPCALFWIIPGLVAIWRSPSNTSTESESGRQSDDRPDFWVKVNRKKCASGIGMVVLIGFITWGYVVLYVPLWNIDNSYVEKAIRKELKKPEGWVTWADLEELKELDLRANQLTEVPKGLEKLTQLKRLFLDDNQLTSVKGLEKLTRLTFLNLEDNPDLTKAQIAELKKALPKCKIIH